MSSQNEIEFNLNSSSSSSNTLSNAKNNDPSMFLVSTHLTGNENYMKWKFSIRIALGAKKKIGFIDGTIKRPESEGSEVDDWISNDCMFRSWLLNAISKEIAGAFIFATTTQELRLGWNLKNILVKAMVRLSTNYRDKLPPLINVIYLYPNNIRS